MTKTQAYSLSNTLDDAGYKRITNCLHSTISTYEYAKSFRPETNDTDANPDYSIFYRFVDWLERHPQAPVDAKHRFTVTIAIMSGQSDVRADLIIGYDKNRSIEDVEELAKDFYELTKRHKL